MLVLASAQGEEGCQRVRDARGKGGLCPMWWQGALLILRDYKAVLVQSQAINVSGGSHPKRS